MLFLQSVDHIQFFNRHEAIGSHKTELVGQCPGFDILPYSFCWDFQLHCLDQLESLNVPTTFPRKGIFLAKWCPWNWFHWHRTTCNGTFFFMYAVIFLAKATVMTTLEQKIYTLTETLDLYVKHKSSYSPISGKYDDAVQPPEADNEPWR